MYEDVTVTKVVSPELVLVSCSESACAGCKGASFCNNKGQSYEALNDKKLPLTVGMKVRLYLKPSKTIMSSIITLIFPLLFFPVAYLIASHAGLNDGFSILIGLGGVAVGFLLAWLYFSHRKKEYSPTVDTVLDDSSHPSLY